MNTIDITLRGETVTIRDIEIADHAAPFIDYYTLEDNTGHRLDWDDYGSPEPLTPTERTTIDRAIWTHRKEED